MISYKHIGKIKKKERFIKFDFEVDDPLQKLTYKPMVTRIICTN